MNVFVFALQGFVECNLTVINIQPTWDAAMTIALLAGSDSKLLFISSFTSYFDLCPGQPKRNKQTRKNSKKPKKPK